MKPQLAYDAIALEYGGNAVFLRPSLRAALHLERLHGGFPELLRKIEEFDTLTIWRVITTAAGMEASEPLFAYVAAHPLKDFQQAAQGPCIELVAAFFPEAPETTTAQPSTAAPTPWGDLFKELYGFATGWLHWPPETAWNATPQEITDAITAHSAKLKAIHGEAEDTDTGPTEEQRKQNTDLGLDPEFDRVGLRALKDLSELREGMAL
ncbi:MAG: hypothetical protein P1U91_00865 [Pseudophaeobacter sp. bin_em_oilr2.035]|uniref:Phage tail assembly chaperone n=1 Tax=Phaeobacter gallaeciensis TaxID=60890 RepID=A0ABD4X479_9RHOB|nr:hypothetical protein [Phaeobacter gallaeciensis]MDF1770483.1 hypothetical protein [Pseudophaeobacter sp. bin_em_oilr2.035]MDE4143179.1 hypothetical protein [Phaeobacter gallaeciensis]MDE4156459.1 hypothetical protein [Phaeobacter gallaeciensis]MDE4160646.1 hypothetical protein [Phaeobacter gallaeciensis]MDE4164260.1 hypothetical protein [Phaeobacter gallaeciensis]